MRISDWSSDVCSSDLPVGDALLLLPVDQPVQGAPVAVENEGATVEHQLVLPADAVEIDERQPRLGDAVGEHPAQPTVVLVDLTGAAAARPKPLGPLGSQTRPDIDRTSCG